MDNNQNQKETTLIERISSARNAVPTFVLKNANVLNVFTNEIMLCDVALYENTIIGLGRYDCRNSYDCKESYLCPGFIDSHVHIESSMSCPSGFAELVLPFGTTTVIADPHEIANVCGLDGIRAMKEMSRGIGLNIYYMFPSCVPCVEFEECNAPLGNEDAAALLYEGVVHGLGEVMDWNAVLNCRQDMIKKLEMFQNRPVDGHAPGLSGAELAAYVLGGPNTDHEAYTYQEVLEKLRMGMKILIRIGSAANNMQEVLRELAQNKIPLENVMLCTDDKHTGNILEEGHINHIVSMAVKAGIPAVEAVKMATINAARAYGLSKKGAIAPGYDGDMVLVGDLEDFLPLEVFVMGQSIKKCDRKQQHCPEALKHTVNIAPLEDGVFELRTEHETIPVIEMGKGQLATTLSFERVPQKDGLFVPNATYVKLACIERHHATGHIGIGIVKNFGLECGAFASTVSHDSHNIVVMGTNDADMRVAVEALQEMGGGYVLVRDTKIVAEIPLPIGGLLSDEPCEKLVDYQKNFLKELAEMGVSQESDPLIRLSFFCLPVIPEARVTTKGVYDVINGCFVG